MGKYINTFKEKMLKEDLEIISQGTNIDLFNNEINDKEVWENEYLSVNELHTN